MFKKTVSEQISRHPPPRIAERLKELGEQPEPEDSGDEDKPEDREGDEQKDSEH